MASYSETTLSYAGEIIGDGKIVVLEPEKWIGKRFPLLDYIDIGDKLKEGKWLVLLYHHDCPKCQEALSTLQHLARLQQIAVVQMPPYGVGNGDGCKSKWPAIGRLGVVREWFAETPILVSIDNGLVVK